MSVARRSGHPLATSLFRRNEGGDSNAWLFLADDKETEYGLAVLVSVNHKGTQEDFIHDFSVSPYVVHKNSVGDDENIKSLPEALFDVAGSLHDELCRIATPFPKTGVADPVGTETLYETISNVISTTNKFLRNRAHLTAAEEPVAAEKSVLADEPAPSDWFPQVITVGILDVGVDSYAPDTTPTIIVGIGGETFDASSTSPAFRAESMFDELVLMQFARSVSKRLDSRSEDAQQALEDHYFPNDVVSSLVEGDTRDTSDEAKLVLDFVNKQVLLESMSIPRAESVTVQTTALARGDVIPDAVLTTSRLVYRARLKWPFSGVEREIEAKLPESSDEGEEEIEEDDAESIALSADGDLV